MENTVPETIENLKTFWEEIVRRTSTNATIIQSQQTLQDQMKTLKVGLDKQFESLSTGIDTRIQNLRSFLLGFAIAVGVFLLAILVLLILVKVSQAKDVASQKEKLKGVEEKSKKNKDELTLLKNQMSELRSQVQDNYNEINATLDKHKQEITNLRSQVTHATGDQRPHPQTPEQFLADANSAVSANPAGYYGPALSAQFPIKYFNRADPVGTFMAGKVEETPSPNAFFCGTVIRGQLYLIPNHKNQKMTSSCVDEFFDYPAGHSKTIINQIVMYATLSYDRSSGYWNIQTKGRIN